MPPTPDAPARRYPATRWTRWRPCATGGGNSAWSASIPPAFIKRKKDAEQGLNAYRRVNDLGLQLVENGGILTSCSCSHHLEAEALRRLIAQCAAKRGLNTQLLYQGFQGPDHPVHPSMPETAYLKVFILRVWKD